MLHLKFHPSVTTEITSSFLWYEEQAQGLGDDFINELEMAYAAIIEFPHTWPLFQNGFRRFLLTKFPFSILYKQTSDSLYIVAIMHNSRKPNYWLERS
jgi:hypothetical protein